jgi:uncharacterized membrane protein YphA (DoxX/SURF4 family)
MKLTFPTRIAEILFAIVMAAFGVLHLKYGSPATTLPAYLPGSTALWMNITGICFLVAALAIGFDKYKKIASYLLALMLIVFILVIHFKNIFHGMYDQPLKDAGLALAAIFIGNNSSKQ